MDGERTQFKDVKLLVAEDYEFNREIVVEMLGVFGIQPDIAVNGKEAVDKCKNEHYDVILMDIKMPVMDGFEAAKAIRDAGNSTTVIIGLTASSLMAQEDLRRAGINDYALKPLELKDLENVLVKHLAHKRA